MDMRTIVAGNWKMHKDLVEAQNLLNALTGWAGADDGKVDLIVAPPFPFLAMAVAQVAVPSVKAVNRASGWQRKIAMRPNRALSPAR